MKNLPRNICKNKQDDKFKETMKKIQGRFECKNGDLQKYPTKKTQHT